jgi:hypothetical protein
MKKNTRRRERKIPALRVPETSELQIARAPQRWRRATALLCTYGRPFRLPSLILKPNNLVIPFLATPSRTTRTMQLSIARFENCFSGLPFAAWVAPVDPRLVEIQAALYTRSRQECCGLGDPASKLSDTRSKCVCPISRLGTSCPTHPQVSAALCGQFQEEHKSFPLISITIRVLRC